jgi:pseudouridine kinase
VKASRGDDAPIVVVGGALVDVRAAAVRATAGLPGRRGESVPGTARLAPGGAGRNVAADLAYFGRRVVLLTAVGDDVIGRWLLDATAAAGVEVTHAVSVRGPTGLFVAVSADGGEPWCVSDAGAVEALTVDHVAQWAPIITRASVVVTDANVCEPAQRAVADVAGSIARVVLATSPEKSRRLCHVLASAEAVVANLSEGRALADGVDPDADWRAVATALVRAGAKRAVLTLGALGIGLADSRGIVDVPAVETPVVDTIGAGDAVAAAVVHGLAGGMPPRAILSMAARAAALVAQSWDATPSSLRELAGGLATS